MIEQPKTVADKVSMLLKGRRNLALLEAGCGAFSHINLEPFSRIIGIDIEQEQLELNRTLQEKILGDLQTYPLPREAFDVVVCWYVIEHLPNPEQALQNMFQALKPDGLLVLTFPHLFSFKGVATKFTPHWFHRFAYWAMRFKGKIFQTAFRLSILPTRLISAAEEHGFSVAYYRSFEDQLTKAMRTRLWPVRAIFATVNTLARIVSFGKCRSLYEDNCELILRKESRPAVKKSSKPDVPIFANEVA